MRFLLFDIYFTAFWFGMVLKNMTLPENICLGTDAILLQIHYECQVVHTSNPSYPGGRDQQDHGSNPA
jgi:hypothetical protein